MTTSTKNDIQIETRRHTIFANALRSLVSEREKKKLEHSKWAKFIDKFEIKREKRNDDTLVYKMIIKA